MPNNDLKTLAALYSLVYEDPSLPSLTSLADQIDASNYNFKKIAALIDEWVGKHPEIKSSFYEKLNNSQATDRFFFGAKEPKQDPESFYREKTTELINKMRDRQPPDNPNPKGEQAHAP
jgi:hypothetical protein